MLQIMLFNFTRPLIILLSNVFGVSLQDGVDNGYRRFQEVAALDLSIMSPVYLQMRSGPLNEFTTMNLMLKVTD